MFEWIVKMKPLKGSSWAGTDLSISHLCIKIFLNASELVSTLPLVHTAYWLLIWFAELEN